MAEESKSQQRVIKLTRREHFEVFASFDESTEPVTPDDQLEDVTDDIFGALELLGGCQMLCKPELDMFDTMSCFEVMDKKMDSRVHRNDAMTVKKAIQKDILKEELSTGQQHALI